MTGRLESFPHRAQIAVPPRRLAARALGSGDWAVRATETAGGIHLGPIDEVLFTTTHLAQGQIQAHFGSVSSSALHIRVSRPSARSDYFPVKRNWPVCRPAKTFR